MWFIVSIVTAAAFWPAPHEIVSVRHFVSEIECRAHQVDDADELLAELNSIGISGQIHLESYCAIDESGESV